MNIIDLKLHGYLDLVTVAVFALAPAVLGLTGGAATLSYVLALVHLSMTLITDGLPISIRGIVPAPLHGMVEVAVGVVLALLGWLAFDGEAGAFYLVMAVVILVVFALTAYRGAST